MDKYPPINVTQLNSIDNSDIYINNDIKMTNEN
jgi:hypothetical protein